MSKAVSSFMPTQFSPPNPVPRKRRRRKHRNKNSGGRGWNDSTKIVYEDSAAERRKRAGGGAGQDSKTDACPFSSHEIDKIVDYMDPNFDGEISLDELQATFRIFRRAQAVERIEAPARAVMRRLQDALNDSGTELELFYHELDTSGDGSVSQGELRTGLQAMAGDKGAGAFRPTEEEIDLVMRYTNPDADGEIDITELLTAFRRCNQPAEAEAAEKEVGAVMRSLEKHMKKKQTRVLDVFRMFDEDRSGSLSRHELRAGLAKLAEPIPKVSAIKKLQMKKEAKTRAAEEEKHAQMLGFLHLMAAAERTGAVVVLDGLNAYMRKFQIRVKDLFRGFDRSGDGRLDAFELQSALAQAKLHFDLEEVDALVTFLDQQSPEQARDGFVDAEELENAIRQYRRYLRDGTKLRRFANKVWGPQQRSAASSADEVTDEEEGLDTTDADERWPAAGVGGAVPEDIEAEEEAVVEEGGVPEEEAADVGGAGQRDGDGGHRSAAPPLYPPIPPASRASTANLRERWQSSSSAGSQDRVRDMGNGRMADLVENIDALEERLGQMAVVQGSPLVDLEAELKARRELLGRVQSLMEKGKSLDADKKQQLEARAAGLQAHCTLLYMGIMMRKMDDLKAMLARAPAEKGQTAAEKAASDKRLVDLVTVPAQWKATNSLLEARWETLALAALATERGDVIGQFNGALSVAHSSHPASREGGSRSRRGSSRGGENAGLLQLTAAARLEADRGIEYV